LNRNPSPNVQGEEGVGTDDAGRTQESDHERAKKSASVGREEKLWMSMGF